MFINYIERNRYAYKILTDKGTATHLKYSVTSVNVHLKSTATSLIQPVYKQPILVFYSFSPSRQQSAFNNMQFWSFPLVTVVGRLHCTQSRSNYLLLSCFQTSAICETYFQNIELFFRLKDNHG